MLHTDLVIGTLKLAAQERVVDKSKDFSMYLDYFHGKFYMLESVKSYHTKYYTYESTQRDLIGFNEWIVNFLIMLGELPEDYSPIYTYEFTCICLDLLQKRVRSDFNKLWIRIQMDKHKLAVDSYKCFRAAEALCSYFPVDFYNQQKEVFNSLHTESLNSTDNHDIHINYLNDLLKATYVLAMS